jgi:protein TonB
MAHGAQLAVPPSRAARRTGAAFAVVLHAAIAGVLLAYEPARSAIFAAAPVMVSLITPQRVEPSPKPPVEIPPKPKPVVKPPPKPEPAPLISAPLEAPAPSPIVEPPPPAQPVPAPVVAAAPVITAPIFAADYLDNPAPYYPQLARRAGEQGRVVLRVLVNPAGRADEIEIRTSSGYPRLDESARDTVRRWRFVPAKRGDEPVPAWVLIPISFRLEG